MSTLFAKLKPGWRWLNAGEMTNPETDFHCWPPGTGKTVVSVQEQFKVSGSTYGMLLRKEGEKTVYLSSFSAAD